MNLYPAAYMCFGAYTAIGAILFVVLLGRRPATTPAAGWWLVSFFICGLWPIAVAHTTVSLYRDARKGRKV